MARRGEGREASMVDNEVKEVEEEVEMEVEEVEEEVAGEVEGEVAGMGGGPPSSGGSVSAWPSSSAHGFPAPARAHLPSCTGRGVGSSLSRRGTEALWHRHCGTGGLPGAARGLPGAPWGLPGAPRGPK